MEALICLLSSAPHQREDNVPDHEAVVSARLFSISFVRTLNNRLLMSGPLRPGWLCLLYNLVVVGAQPNGAQVVKSLVGN